MENCSKGILEPCRVSLWRLISRYEVHLVKYLVLPLSQLKKTFRDGDYGYFGELKLTTFPSQRFSHNSGRVYPNLEDVRALKKRRSPSMQEIKYFIIVL